MTNRDIDIILVLIKEYVNDLLSHWKLSDEEKSLVAFEQKYMPYTEYSGKQSIDHVLFRKFLRHFNPQNIEDSIAGNVIEIYREQIEKLEAENAALRKKVEELEQLTYAALVPIVSQAGNATIAPNVLNVWGEVTSLNITKGNDIDGITNLYLIRFVAGENLQVSFTGFDLLWYGGSVPTWKAGSTYEINIVDNLALWAEFTSSAS